MIEKVLFHIGSPKTGTSILQSHLQQNRKVLREKGVFYPVTISPYSNVYRTFESHHLLTYSIAGWDRFTSFSPERFFQRAEQACAQYDMNTLMLSAENTYWLPKQVVVGERPDEEKFWGLKREYVEKLGRYLEGYETRIIVYFRRQDHWIESWYNQQIKNGNYLREAFEAFWRRHNVLLDYEKNLELWAATFGRENILVRPYEKEQLDDGLLQDFLALLNLGSVEEYPLKSPPRFNAKLDRTTMQFMNYCNGLDLDPADKRWLGLCIRRISNQFERQEVFKSLSLMRPDERIALLEHYEPGNDAVARTYGTGRGGRLFVETLPDVDEPWEEGGELPTDYVAQMLIGILMDRTARGKATESASDNSGSNETLSEKLLRLPVVGNRFLPIAERDVWERYLWGMPSHGEDPA